MFIKRPVIFFDGVCNLCNSSVRFFIRRDPRKNLRFAPLQSATGQRILNLVTVDRMDIADPRPQS